MACDLEMGIRRKVNRRLPPGHDPASHRKASPWHNPREFLSAFSGVAFCAIPATGRCLSLCDQLRCKVSGRQRDRGNGRRQAKAPKPKMPRTPSDASQRSSLLKTEILRRSIAHKMLRRKSDGVTPTVRRNEVVNELVSAKPSIRPTSVTERVRSSSKVLARSMRRPT
jgi:hypothetical protein